MSNDLTPAQRAADRAILNAWYRHVPQAVAEMAERTLDALDAAEQRIAALESRDLAGAICPECGPQQSTDEDGCCSHCGATATGAWLARMQSRIAELALALDQANLRITALTQERDDACQQLAAERERVDALQRDLDRERKHDWEARICEAVKASQREMVRADKAEADAAGLRERLEADE